MHAAHFRVTTTVFGNKSLRVHTTLMHCAHHSLRGLVITEDIHISQVMSPSTISVTRTNFLMRNGQATPAPPGGNLSRSVMSSSLHQHFLQYLGNENDHAFHCPCKVLMKMLTPPCPSPVSHADAHALLCSLQIPTTTVRASDLQYTCLMQFTMKSMSTTS